MRNIKFLVTHKYLNSGTINFRLRNFVILLLCQIMQKLQNNLKSNTNILLPIQQHVHLIRLIAKWQLTPYKFSFSTAFLWFHSSTFNDDDDRLSHITFVLVRGSKRYCYYIKKILHQYTQSFIFLVYLIFVVIRAMNAFSI